jgi:hypothetical protein
MLLGAEAAQDAPSRCSALESCERLVLVNAPSKKPVPWHGSFRLIFAATDWSARLNASRPSRIRSVPCENNAKTDLVINATSIGMKRTDPALVPAGLLTPNLMVYDTVYATGKPA